MGAMEAFAIPEARDRLQDAVDALVDESIDGVSTHALGADLVDIRRAVDRLEAEFIRRLHRFHCARGAQADGGGSTVSWLRRCGMTAMGAAPVERFMTVPRTSRCVSTPAVIRSGKVVMIIPSLASGWVAPHPPGRRTGQRWAFKAGS